MSEPMFKEDAEIAEPTPVWLLNDAVAFIRQIEPKLKTEAHYFCGLCGGVLRNGMSHKDLDIILIPLNGDTEADEAKAKEIIAGLADAVCDVPQLREMTEYNNQKVAPLSFWRVVVDGKDVDFIFQS